MVTSEYRKWPILEVDGVTPLAIPYTFDHITLSLEHGDESEFSAYVSFEGCATAHRGGRSPAINKVVRVLQSCLAILISRRVLPILSFIH